MEREILFRGKRCDNKEWAEGALWDKCGSGCTIISGDGTHGDCFAYVIPETVGQFTGLCDKNGVKIFEGDILTTETDKPMIVGWSNKFASFVLNRDGWAFSHWFGESCNPENCIVIGNIHDNQELLK